VRRLCAVSPTADQKQALREVGLLCTLEIPANLVAVAAAGAIPALVQLLGKQFPPAVKVTAAGGWGGVPSDRTHQHARTHTAAALNPKPTHTLTLTQGH
jgi:hypothetical protein